MFDLKKFNIITLSDSEELNQIQEVKIKKYLLS